MTVHKTSNNLYEIDCVLFVDFEHERVAQNEVFKFKTKVVVDSKIKE